MPPELVTAGIPVYRGERFLAETLRSVQRQTHRDLAIVVSLDGPQPDAEAICAPFLGDPRFTLVVRPERLGWRRHIEVLMERTETPFWFYLQQDDLLDARYVEALLDAARAQPDAAVTFCDIEAFGTMNGTLVMPSVDGTPAARQLALLAGHHLALAFRGITRVQALRAAGGVPRNEVDDFASEAVWMSAAARWGPLLRVPGALYRKRFHDANEHAKRHTWPPEKRRRAWIAYSAAMLREAMRVDAQPHERRLLWHAAVGRVSAFHQARAYLGTATWTPAERHALLDAFLRYVDAAAFDVPVWLGCERAVAESLARTFFGDG